MSTNTLRSLQQLQQRHDAIQRFRSKEEKPQNSDNDENLQLSSEKAKTIIIARSKKIDFISWLHLFVEALEFADVDTLINAQLTCRHVLLLMALHNLFRQIFFKIQPFKRRFISTQKQVEVANRPVYWVSSDFLTKDDDEEGNNNSSFQQQQIEKFSVDDHPFIENETSRAQLFLAVNNNMNEKLNCASWKCVAKRFLLQTQGVFCRVSTPEFFRGVWRMSERSFWQKSPLDIVKSPPFFMAPRIRRKNFWKLRQSPFPPKIAQQQQFQLLLQRQSRNGNNAMGVFLNVQLPIEGSTISNARRENDSEEDENRTEVDNKIKALYSIGCLDQSLFVLHQSPTSSSSSDIPKNQQQYQAIRRFQGSTTFQAGRNNSGFVFNRKEVSNFDPELPFFRDEILAELRKKHQEEHSAASNALFSSEIAPLHSCEDIVIEVEVFSLGPGIEEADDVLTYAESFGQVLALTLADENNGKAQNLVTLPMQIAIWGMIRNLSHTDPYTLGIMAKRKKLLAAILLPLIRAMTPESDTELCLQVTGVLWNLSDVDVPPVSRSQLQEIIQFLLVRIDKYLLSEKSEYAEDEHVKRYADSVNSDVKMTADPTQTAERRHQRRYYVSLTPSLLGCLWNFPQSLSGTINFFLDRRKNVFGKLISETSEHYQVFLLVILRMIKLELRQDEQNKVRETTFYALRKQEKEAKAERRLRRQHEKARTNNDDDDDDVSSSEEDEENEKFSLRTFEKPKCAILFAACHFLARAIFYLSGKVNSITKVLQEQDPEQVLCDGVACLKKNTSYMGQLGVALFSRDFAIFFVPLLIGTEKRSTRGCLELASFAFDCGYWTSMDEEPEQAEQQQQQTGGNDDEEEE